MKNETQKDIQKLEMDLLVSKNMKLETEEQMKRFYESQMDKLKKQNEELNKQLTEYSNENLLKIQKEVDKVIEKIRDILGINTLTKMRTETANIALKRLKK